MVKKPVLFLLHIKDATELIAEYLGNYTFDQSILEALESSN